jgi:hypothetical protein
MAFVYAVRCNFARPDLEADWNGWYSGKKLRQLVSKPLFLSGQRFAATALDTRRKYLAMWLVESPDAFATPEYRADWGFADWASHIRDWSRDLYRSELGASDPLFDIGSGEALYFAAFDGMSDDAARAGRARVAAMREGVHWLDAVGLDRSAPVLGLRKVDRAWRPPPLAAGSGLTETLFEPITERAFPDGR